MAKSWPDYMGTYKALVLEYGVGESRKAKLPQFQIRVFLTDYYDPKQGEWFDVSDNNWSMNAYLVLYGRKDGVEDAEITETLNHQQVCKVFGWDGCGFEYLTTPGRFAEKIIQVRIAENTGEGAKTPCQIEWIDVEDADPNSGLQCLDSGQVKTLESKFAHLWKGKKTPAAVSAKPKTTPTTPAKATAKKTEPPKTEEPPADDGPEAGATPPVDDAAAKKKTLLEKSKRLRKEAAKATPPAKKTEPPKADTPPAGEGETAVPADYGKTNAWSDIVELRDKNCTDEQQSTAWQAAIAEIAEDGDEDKLDARGWWTVKEQVLAEVGSF